MIRASFQARRGTLLSPEAMRTPISISMPHNGFCPLSSVPFFVFRDTGLHNFLQQRVGQRLIGREPKRSPRSRKAFEFLLELLDHTRPRREKAAMILERRVPPSPPPSLAILLPVGRAGGFAQRRLARSRRSTPGGSRLAELGEAPLSPSRQWRPSSHV